MTAKANPFRLVAPCAHCPFRSDIRPYLHKARVREIEAGLVRGTFSCHETCNGDRTDDDDEGEVYHETGDESHCAGALILLEKLERPSQMMRIGERLGLYDRTKLKMDAPVVNAFKEMIEK